MENSSPTSTLDLPGFRFHPTEEELLDFYLWRQVHGKRLELDIIATVHLYRHDPWELPGLAKLGEKEWYFFVPRERRPANGGRPSRTTARGFWKATGSDRPVRSAADPKQLIGLKKTLVFYRGRAPHGTKTDWVMNEYRLPETSGAAPKDDLVLCKVYRKATSLKELEQRAALEELRSAAETSSSSREYFGGESTAGDRDEVFRFEEEEVVWKDTEASTATTTTLLTPTIPVKMAPSSIYLPTIPIKTSPSSMDLPPMSMRTCMSAMELSALPALEIPARSMADWMHDPFATQLHSPWMLDQWSPYAHIMNF